MKIAVCSCGKSENKYIKEWVTYYILVGVDHIFLYDNNETYGEYFEDVIKEYIDSGFIEIIDWRGKSKPQCKIEQDCWDKHHEEYDWICFFDCDEFLSFTKDKNIKGYLSRKIFDPYNVIQVNFLAYGDNGLINYQPGNISTRFIKPLDVTCKGPLPFPNNYHTKSIVRGTANDIQWIRDGHTPITTESKHCNNCGTLLEGNLSICETNYSLAAIRHYSTKTIHEFILNKFKRGDVLLDSSSKFSDFLRGILIFFSFNEITNEKITIATELVKQMYETPHTVVVSEARGRIGNTLFTIAAGAYFAYKNNKQYYLYINHENAQYILNDTEGNQLWYTNWIMLNPMFKNVKCISDDTELILTLTHAYIDCYEKNASMYNEIPTNVDANIFIHGFRQSPKYFDRQWCIDFFKPDENLISAIYDKYGKDINNYVSINIRRGDFLNPANSWIMYVNPLEWYNKIINMYDDTQNFIISSDDIEWCKQNFKGDKFIFNEGIDNYDKIFVDLFIQTLCKDNIISNSTFSWWGAYLNIHKDRKVYYHSPWYVNETTDNDIIPENDNWIDVQ